LLNSIPSFAEFFSSFPAPPRGPHGIASAYLLPGEAE
jgi:hypothetical protein